LDMSIDGLGVLVASLLALKYGQVPIWYIAVAFARPLFLAGIWLRRRLNLLVYDLPPSRSRRLFAGLQLGFLAVVLMPVFSPPVTYLGALIFGLPLLLGFVRDWLAVSGKLQVGALSSRTRFLADGLPLTLRLAALVLNLALAVHWSASIERPDSLLAFMFLANFVLGSLVILGVMPRIASIFALVDVGFILMITSFTPQLVMLAVDYSILLYIGSGSLSLWPIDDRLFRTPVGGKPIIQPSAAPHQPAADKMRPDTAPQPVLDRFKESFPSLEGST
jgi:CDP-diacylglycerol--glycerol-3-phosphate 3-phosphatidyltransferase